MRSRMIGLGLAMLTLAASARSEEKASAEPKAKGRKIRVAAVSFVPHKFDLRGNAARLERAFRRAQAGGAQLAVAPEGALDGYVVNEIIAGKADAAQIRPAAIPIDGAVIQRFRKLASELQMCLVFGFAERIGDDIFNAAVFIDDRGIVRGKYHKMQFAEGYDRAWWFNRLGKQSRAFDTPLGRCGVLICNDRWNPRLARIPALDGAQFLVIPSFGSRSPAQDRAVLSRGRENGLPVIEANVGVTLIVNSGQIAAVDRKEEGLTFAEITIPPPAARKPAERDAVEQAFLKWRRTEMQRRLKRTTAQVRRNAIDRLRKRGGRLRIQGERVVEVNLQETATTDDDLRALTVLQEVREVSLHRTRITDAGCALLKQLSHLERLYLTDTRVGDKGMSSLAQLDKLKTLGLSGTRVTDAGLVRLQKLAALKSLFLIDARVTAAGVAKLQQALPDCDIVH